MSKLNAFLRKQREDDEGQGRVTTMVNYVAERHGVTRRTEGMRTRKSKSGHAAQFPNPKMHKAFPPREVLISKGESFNFLLLQSVSGTAKYKT